MRSSWWIWKSIRVIGVTAGTIFSVFPIVFLSTGTSFGQSAFNPNPKTAAEAIEQLVMANRILANEGIFDYLGHVSVRNPENPGTFFISRALAPEQVTKADILEVDLDGKVLTKTPWQPYSERIIQGRLVYSGIMEKYPNLKFIAHHCGAMAPFFSARIPLGAAAGEGEIMKLTKPPVEYFKRFYGDTVLGGNTSAMMCGYTFFGADHMVFGTDYPYPGDVLLEAVIKAIERMNIAEEEKAKIFSKNARQLLHLA